MIVLYTVLILFLGAVNFLIGRRVARLERRFVAAATTAERLTRDVLVREGNSPRAVAEVAAKRQFLLGQAVQERDRIEARYDTWEGRADKFGRLVDRVRSWKGKKLPYTFGVMDVSALLYAADQFGVGAHVNVRQLVQLVTALVTNG